MKVKETDRNNQFVADHNTETLGVLEVVNSNKNVAYDMTLGYNIWDPNMFEVHFCSVAIPKPGGVIV